MPNKKRPPYVPPPNIPAPTGLTATKTSSGVRLEWSPVQNATSYWIYRNGKSYTIAFGVNEYLDQWVLSGSYTYEVAAVVNSVLGAKSSAVTITI
jgi:hypothetical protein